MELVSAQFKKIEWQTLLIILPIISAGLVTMHSFTSENVLFERQVIWVIVAVVIFLVFSIMDWRFLKRTDVIVTLFLLNCGILIALFSLGKVVHGAQSWFNFGSFSFQPADISKLILILVLAKYFSRRHIEIRQFRHIIISGIYAFVIFLLVFLQPDFGSAIVIFFIWLGMVLVSGLSKKHLAVVLLAGVVAFASLWYFIFEDYQKDRIITFINPMTDIRGAGYNAYQSMVAVGSGGILGKGVGYGTQSRLNFLPEYQTDFIFAAFAEEWGFIGAFIIVGLYVVLVRRIIKSALVGISNFEVLFGLGVAVYFIAHIVINVGMNIGLLPVTGITLPFMSYGGSHLVAEFGALGILMGMRKYARTVHKEAASNEVVGV